MQASRMGNTEILQILLENDADPNLTFEVSGYDIVIRKKCVTTADLVATPLFSEFNPLSIILHPL